MSGAQTKNQIVAGSRVAIAALCALAAFAARPQVAHAQGTLTVSVTGSGTVTSALDDINCTSSGGPDCSETYAESTPVVLTASPETGWELDTWTGCTIIDADSCEVIVVSDTTVTATFTQVFDLTVTRNPTSGGTVSGPGITCGSDCTETYDSGESVTLTATANEGWVFDSWTGCTSTTNSCTFTMTADRTVTANFTQVFDLTVTRNPTSGGTVSGPGITCGSDCTETYDSGESVTLTATANEGWVFDSWTGCTSTTNSCTFTMTADRTVTANFTELVDLTVTRNPTSGGTVTGPGITCGSDCTETYESGTSVTLTATPATGWALDSWSGCTSSTNSCTFTMTADRTVTANFVQLFDLTVTRNPTAGGSVTGPGINCGSECTETYEDGTSVTLTATANDGWAFDSWSGCTSSTNSCTFTMSADRTVTANFIETFILTVSRNPTSGGTVTGPGISCGSDCTEEYEDGTSVTLTAAANSGWVFDSWTGCTSTTNSCTFTMTADRTVTANFTQLFDLTVTRNPTSGGSVTGPGITCGSDCTQTYEDGTSVTLTATPATGWGFESWSGCESTTDSCTFTMTADRAVTANFIRRFTLTVTRNPAEGGSVTGPGINCGSDCTEVYKDGTSVTLTATAATGWVFGSWTGCTSSTNSCTFTMTADRTVTANFLELFTLSVSKTGQGTVTSSPSGINCGSDCSEPYANGTSVTLTATPASGWAFTGWSGSGCSGTGTCTVSMTQNRTVSATFKPVLTVGVNGEGKVTSNDGRIDCPGDCTEIYDFGTRVTLTATAAAGEVFHDWSGCNEPNGNVCTVDMTDGRSVTANFVPTRKLTVSVTTSGIGAAGTVTSSPAGISCPGDCEQDYQLGTTVTLTAQPGEFTSFTEWTGCQGSSGTTCTAQMSDHRSVTASFVALLTITETGLRGGLLGASYADTVQVTGGAETKTWSLVAGSLPPGLALDPETGVISGTAVALGNYTFTLRVESEAFEPAQKALSIRISEPQDVQMTAVVDHLLLGSSTLTPDQLNYLDLIGNVNGRFDIGDFRAFVLNGGGAAASRTEKEEP